MEGVGRYTLTRRIGAGGMAEIWKAKVSGPAGFEKVLAIKKILPQHTNDEEFVDMFIAEAKLAAQLVHPNIVQVFDFGQSDGHDYFIAMEYVPGPNLSALQRRLKKTGAHLPPEVAIYIAIEVAKGLGYAHLALDQTGKELGIIHRDVSPQNLLVSYGGEIKITDFGIAKVADALSRTTEGQVRGKLSYMSPEQGRLKKLDHRSDLFSLGVVLYHLCTGRPLFGGATSQEIFAHVMNYEEPPADELFKLPSDFAETLYRALHVDPDQRFQTATELEVALTTLIGPDGIVQARRSLSSLVRKIFEDELAIETRPDTEGVVTEVGFVTKLSDTTSLRHKTGENSSGERSITMSEPIAAQSSTKVEAPPRPVIRRGMRLIVGVLVLAVVGLSGVLLKVLWWDARDVNVAAATPTPGVTAAVTHGTTAKPAATARKSVKKTPRMVRRTPRATPTVVAAKGKGTLIVKARPWAEVYIGKRKLSRAAPVGRYPIDAGTVTVRFVNPAIGVNFTKRVTVRADERTTVNVDMSKRTAHVEK